VAFRWLTKRPTESLARIRGRAASVANADELDRPSRSVLDVGQDEDNTIGRSNRPPAVMWVRGARRAVANRSGAGGLRRAGANREARHTLSLKATLANGIMLLNPSGPVAGTADVANHAVGGGGAEAITKNSELRPEQALYPTVAGAIVSAGG